MEILKYRKLKNTMYELELDNGSTLTLYDETIIKYELLLNKVIAGDKLKALSEYNDQLGAYQGALKYLSKKMRSELEIKKYLTKKEFEAPVIEETVKLLKEKGYLDNQKFITSYINDQVNLTSNGPEKIKYNLVKLGFSENEININQDFSSKIKALITKKIKLNHRQNAYTLKMNITSYLINLGYPKELFIEELDKITVNDDDLIKKEYALLRKKYGNKYQDQQLRLFIRDKLYKKGYNIEGINEVTNETEF